MKRFTVLVLSILMFISLNGCFFVHDHGDRGGRDGKYNHNDRNHHNGDRHHR